MRVVHRLTGTLKPYAWGSPTFIPDLLGEEPTGEPQAELWLGAHGSSSARAGDQPLDELIAADPPGVLGAASVQNFGSRLPFLMKVLAAAKPLSLQAHPTREQAEQGHAREEAAGVAADAGNRLYKDSWPKPELLCALVDTEALCGFRDPGESHALFARLGVPAALELVAPLAEEQQPAADRLAAVLARVLRLSADERAVVSAVTAAAAEVGTDGGSFGLFTRTAAELGEHFGDDPGILAALLLNRVALRPGQAVYLPPGNLHAYLHGGGIEIMANSDNVLRGGLTAKHVDVDALIPVLDFTPGPPALVEPVEEAPGRWRYPTPAPEFALWRLEPRDSPVELPVPALGRVLLVVDGAATVIGAGDPVALGRGQAAFARAGEQLRVEGRGTVIVGGPGLEG